MSDLSQIKTITGEYSGFADTVARETLSGKADVSGFELDGNGHISAYNGSAFAGGSSGTTYTSPSGTILIDGNTLEASNSGFIVETNPYAFQASAWKMEGFKTVDTFIGATQLICRAYRNYAYVEYTPSGGSRTTAYITEVYPDGPQVVNIPEGISGNVEFYDLYVTANSGGNTTCEKVKFATENDLANYQTIEGMSAYQPSGDYQAAGDYYSASNPSGFITGVDLTPYQEKSGMSAYQPVGEYYSASNPSGFLTEVPEGYATTGDLEDLSTAIAETFQPQSAMTAYQTVEDMSAYQPSGDYLTSVPATYLQNTDLSTADGKITAISGIPLSAGGASYTGDAQGALDEMYANSGKYILNDQNGVHIGNSNTGTLNGFAQGGNNSANSYSLAQGFMNKANGYSVAQGQMCTATDGSIAQGIANSASDHSQAFGNHTRANNSGMAIGGYNDIASAAFVIGNGTSAARSDCFYIDSSGNVSAAGKISANGVELGGGGGSVPQYVTDAADYVSANSGMIDETVGTVSANSGTWGGSALPISAGPGIKLEMVDSTLAISTTPMNETILWSGNVVGSAFSITLGDNLSNYNFVYVQGFTNDNNGTRVLDIFTCTDPLAISGAFGAGTQTCTNWGQKFWLLEFTDTTVKPIECSEMQWGTTSHYNMNSFGITKVIGFGHK